MLSAQRVHRLEEPVEVGVAVVGGGVDVGGLGVGLAADLLGLPVRFRLDDAELPLLLAGDPRRLARPFGAVELGDPLPLGDHPGVDLLAHGLDVVDLLDPEVEDLDAEVAGAAAGVLEDLLGQLVAPVRDLLRRLGLAQLGDVLGDDERAGSSTSRGR